MNLEEQFAVALTLGQSLHVHGQFELRARIIQTFPKDLAILGGLLLFASTQSPPGLSRSIYAKVRNGAVLTAAWQPQP